MAWANWFSNLWGKRSAAEIKEALIEKEPTAGYAGQPQTRLFGADLDDIPLFTLWRARQMLRDPVVSFGLAARNALLSAAEIEVTSKTAGVKEYIGRLFSAIWEKHSPRIGETKQWGYGGFQLLFKENAGILEIEGLKDFDPYDIRAEELEGKICGFTVKANAGRYAAGDAQPGAKKLYAPRALWTTYKSRAQNAYGESMLRNAYSPWYEKWMNHGAKRVIRQRMIKDAYRGDMIRFPMDRKVILPNGDEMSWKSVAQEVVENIMAGGTLVLPKVLDRDGRDLVDYTQAKDTGNPEAIWRWNEEVNRDIWYGLETPKEIIEAASSGSGYSGRSIPFVIALSMAAVEFAEYLKCFDRDVFRPLVALQFGLNVQYDVKPKDLIESFAKKLGGSQMGGASVGGNAQEPPPPPAGQPARPPQIPSGPNDNGQQPQQFSEPAQFAEGPTPDPFADLALQNAAEYIAKVLREMTRNVPENLGPESLDDLLAKLDALLARYTPEITKDLSDAQLAAMLAAHANVAEQIAKTGHAAAGAMGLPAAPPASLIKEFSDGSGFIRFPVVEDAIETLRASPVFAGETWRETAEAVKQGAFGITADLRADTLSKVREALSEQLEDGLSRAEFVENAHAIIGRGMLSDSHLAQVFRNNVGQSLADARERALSAPLVVDAFPYRQRVATHDNRVRPEHRALETQGLNGTAIYRADDPAWRALRAPFSWNCRCDDIPVGVADAAAAGVREAQEWLKRAEALADEKGGARALYFAETAPQRPEHVPWPTFEGQQILPAEGWERDQFDDSEASSGGTWITIGGQPEGDKKHKGGFPVQISSEGVILKGGPKALRGKHVSQVQSHFETERKARKEAGEKDAFGKVGDFFDKAAAKARKELDRHEAKAPGISKNFDKIAEYQGHKWDIPAKEYAALARELYPQIHQHIQERNDARAYASTRLKVWKSTASAMENRSGKQGQKPKGRTDYTQGGFDVVGRELAKMFPSLGWGSSGDFEARDSEADYAALTWELIKEEKQNPSIVSREFHAKVDDYLENHFKTAVASHGKPSPIDLEEYDPDQFAEGTHHAPSGGITIGGTFYKGGEFIPGEVVAKATKEERAKLERGEGDKPAAEPHTLTRHEFHKQEKEKAGYDPQATNKAYWGHVRAALEAGKEVPEHVKEHYAEVMGGLPEVKEKPKGHDKTFPTAGDVMKAGGTYGDYERPISQAYLNEEIDADHPAYQAISKNPLTAEQFDRNKRWLGQHVAAGVSSKTFGTITDVTPDGKSFIVTDAEGNTSTHSPQYTEHVGALIEQKLATGGNASKELDYIAPKIAAEYVANGENVSAAMKRHGLPHLNAKIRTRITEEADKIRAEANKPSDARAAAMAKREATDKAAEPAAAVTGSDATKTTQRQRERIEATLSSAAKVRGKQAFEATGKLPHEMTLDEYSAIVDPHNTKWQSGQKPEFEHKEWVKAADIHAPHTIHTGALEMYADGSEPSLLNTLKDRQAAENVKPAPAAETPFALTNKPEAAKPKFEEKGKGAQAKLFGTEGLKGEMNLFPTEGTPDDMVYKPKGNPPEKHADSSPGDSTKAPDPVTTPTTPTAAASIPQAHETPRQTAKRATKAAADSEYAHARNSEISNMGEDLMGSARHRANAWRSLAEAEENGTAEEFVTRKHLLRNEPHTLSSTAGPTTAFSHLAAHLAINAFPQEPGTYPKNIAKYKHSSGEPYDVKTPEQLRAQYYNAYRDIKAEATRLANEHVDPRKVTSELAGYVRNKIYELRGKDMSGGGHSQEGKDHYNPVANNLADMYKRLADTGKTSVTGRIHDFTKRIAEKYGKEPSLEMLEASKGHVLDVMEGKSFNETFGTKGAGSARKFNPADVYVKHAVREGGRMIDANTVEAGKKHLLENVGLRGVQWGNYVSDDERQHHLKQSAEALADLADVTGLPDSAISLGGRLGLAIGARGHGGALAHYEPDLQVINLTRAGGVGSLAHEWGHAFDHYLNDFKNNYGAGSYFSVYAPKGAAGEKEVRDIHAALHKSGYADRLSRYCREQGMSKKERGYWTSTIECFARTFERHVQNKLHAEGRENTYLTGLRKEGHPLWPTNEEMKTIGPAFDKFFEAVRERATTKKQAAE